MKDFIQWMEEHMMTCFYKRVSGLDCPGCGMQRSFIELMKGNLYESFVFYPALIPVLFTLLFTFAHLIFSFRNGAAVIKYSFIFSIGVIVLSFTIKMLR
ncbi:MAG: DUF2752 domain-containing protein [Bacteroidota bacterium]|nr:DUF2752 domain-containing protein [Bacteroidota bacterium]